MFNCSSILLSGGDIRNYMGRRLRMREPDFKSAWVSPATYNVHSGLTTIHINVHLNNFSLKEFVNLSKFPPWVGG